MFYVNEVEIIYRRKNLKIPEYIKSTNDVELIFRKIWTKDLDYREACNVIYLSNAHQVLCIQHHTTGATNGTIYDIKQLVFTALKVNAASLIIAHNHPSGMLQASDADIKVTEQLKTALNFFNIKLLDSLILTSNSILSILN